MRGREWGENKFTFILLSHNKCKTCFCAIISLRKFMAFFLNIDNFIENFFLSIRSPWGVDFFSTVTRPGAWRLIIFLAILMVVLFWLKSKKEYILPFLTTVLGAEISGQILKILFHRARPAGGLEIENTFSFPSGHALIAAAFYGFLIYYFRQNAKSRLEKNIYLATGLFLILLIGLSRLYLGAHFFSDVIGGYIIGAIWLAVGIYIQRKNTPQI